MKYFKIEHNHVGVFAKGQIVSTDDIEKAKFTPFLDQWVKVKAVSETADPNPPAEKPPTPSAEHADKTAPPPPPAETLIEKIADVIAADKHP